MLKDESLYRKLENKKQKEEEEKLVRLMQNLCDINDEGHSIILFAPKSPLSADSVSEHREYFTFTFIFLMKNN
jgi:hypothetical protein